jgi:hypothetical protein
MKENLSILCEKLSTIEYLLKTQAAEIQTYRSQNPSANYEDLLIAQQKATRTNFERLRDDIDELVLFTAAFLKSNV